MYRKKQRFRILGTVSQLLNHNKLLIMELNLAHIRRTFQSKRYESLRYTYCPAVTVNIERGDERLNELTSTIVDSFQVVMPPTDAQVDITNQRLSQYRDSLV